MKIRQRRQNEHPNNTQSIKAEQRLKSIHRFHRLRRADKGWDVDNVTAVSSSPDLNEPV